MMNNKQKLKKIEKHLHRLHIPSFYHLKETNAAEMLLKLYSVRLEYISMAKSNFYYYEPISTLEKLNYLRRTLKFNLADEVSKFMSNKEVYKTIKEICDTVSNSSKKELNEICFDEDLEKVSSLHKKTVGFDYTKVLPLFLSVFNIRVNKRNDLYWEEKSIPAGKLYKNLAYLACNFYDCYNPEDTYGAYNSLMRCKDIILKIQKLHRKKTKETNEQR